MTPPEDAVEIIFYLFDELSGEGGFADAGETDNCDDRAIFFEYPLFEGIEFLGAVVESVAFGGGC